MNISFGKKIPIAKCQIFDNKQQKFVPAVINEYDCKTKRDALEVKKLGEAWRFAPTIAMNMDAKYNCIKANKENFYHFFNIENENKEILGLALCKENDEYLDVHFIETKQDKRHKYAGQTLLAAIAGYTLDIEKCNLRIKSSLKNAFNFYQRICGFKRVGSKGFEISEKKIPQFITQTEERTKAPIIELKA